MTFDEMKRRIAEGEGFIAALDQSGGSTPKALRGYGIADDEWDGDEAMFAAIHRMRCRIVNSPSFASGKVLGAILFERTMDGCSEDGSPIPELLSRRGVVPFLKVDKGMEDEADGAQLMKPIPGLEDLCHRARSLGVFGTKMRSVVNAPDDAGVAANIRQQMDYALEILSFGLIPILEPEVTIGAEDRSAIEALVLSNFLYELGRVPEGQQVMLKLSIPAQPGTYDALVKHPKVLRVVALSGGYDQAQACRELAKNPGMIASFSRALLQDLSVKQDDDEFDRILGTAIDRICAASMAPA